MRRSARAAELSAVCTTPKTNKVFCGRRGNGKWIMAVFQVWNRCSPFCDLTLQVRALSC